VRAAIAVQEIMIDIPNVPLRIGIHIGDVISEGKNVFGDGVNVASRIETFAVPGSIFISEKVRDEIKNHSGIETVSLGKFALKNINEPIEIFAIKNDKLIVPQKGTLEGKGERVFKKRTSAKKKILIVSAVVVILLVTSFLAYQNYSPHTTLA